MIPVDKADGLLISWRRPAARRWYPSPAHAMMAARSQGTSSAFVSRQPTRLSSAPAPIEEARPTT